MALMQTYKLLHSKENHKPNKKTTYGLGESTCKCDLQGLNFQNLQKLVPLNNKKPNKKMGRRPIQTFLQRKHLDSQ